MPTVTTLTWESTMCHAALNIWLSDIIEIILQGIAGDRLIIKNVAIRDLRLSIVHRPSSIVDENNYCGWNIIKNHRIHPSKSLTHSTAFNLHSFVTGPIRPTRNQNSKIATRIEDDWRWWADERWADRERTRHWRLSVQPTSLFLQYFPLKIVCEATPGWYRFSHSSTIAWLSIVSQYLSHFF